jgi:xanthine phosphoribosyltransferase
MENKMKLLEQRILQEGKVYPGNILNVGSFLNQQIDVMLYKEMALEWKRLFTGTHITKIVTIETSGIGLSCITGLEFGAPVLFARKFRGKNLDTNLYTTTVTSYTHGVDYPITIPKEYLRPEDTVLIIDDFLANGCALDGLIRICKMAGATIAGVGIAVEKGFQSGGKRIREEGIRIEALAIIDKMSEADGQSQIVFREA